MSPIPIGILAAQGGFSYNPVAAYDLISTQGTTIAFVNSFSFGSLGTLAANYKHIEFRVMAKTAGGTSDTGQLIMRVNSSGPYSNQRFNLAGAGGEGVYFANPSSTIGNNEFINLGETTTQTGPSGGNTGHHAHFIIRISDAFQPGKRKNISYQAAFYNNDFQTFRFGAAMHHTSTDAISSVEFREAFSNSFLTARFALYGIRG
jgi:hypothetical protein